MNILKHLFLYMTHLKYVHIDELTSCRNRNYYDMIVKEKYIGKEVYVLFVDINNLKLINDTMGHSTGSHYIKEIASELRRIQCDDICRIGGDEFVLISTKEMTGYEQIEHISYGLYVKEPYEDISSAVRKADESMQHHKDEYRKKEGIYTISQIISEGEDSINFSSRIKEMGSTTDMSKAGYWDGYRDATIEIMNKLQHMNRKD